MAVITAGRWKTYQAAHFNITRGLLDGNPDIRMALFTSASNVNTLTAHEIFANLTNELATANGYTAGGVLLLNPVWARDAGFVRLTADNFDSLNPAWEASGGDIGPFRYRVLYVDGTVLTLVNPLIAVSLADESDADVTVTDGNPLLVTFSADGLIFSEGAYVNS